MLLQVALARSTAPTSYAASAAASSIWRLGGQSCCSLPATGHQVQPSSSFAASSLDTASTAKNKNLMPKLGAFNMPRGFAASTTAVNNPTPAGSSDKSTEVPESQIEEKGVQRKLGGAGSKELYTAGHVAAHPSASGFTVSEAGYVHEPYDPAYLESIKPTHLPPKDLADRAGLAAVRLMRRGFDLATGYGPTMTEAKWLQRMIFLETVAGVPGMVAGMLRHLHSLRLMRRDKGWIHTLLEEAENERMHLLSFLELRKPGPLFRACVLAAQGIFFNAYFIAYLVWPKACHSFVGYLEEEAVRTYTHALADIDAGKVWQNTEVPSIAKTYWQLKPDASMRDLILAIRADEACHSHVNHTLKAVPATAPNPFAMGKSHLP